SNAVAEVSERTRAVACPESIAALTRRRSQWKRLGTIVNSFALVQRGCQRAQRSRVWPGADGFMIAAAVRRRSSKWHPGIAVIIAKAVNGVGAGGRIRNQGAAGLLVSPKNWVKPCVRSRIVLVLPQTFAAFRLGWCQKFRR